MPTVQRRIAQQQRAAQQHTTTGAGYNQYISHLQTMRTNFNQQIDNLILAAPGIWGTSGSSMSTNAGVVSAVTDRQKNPRAVAAGRKGAAARRRALAARQQQPQGKTATAGGRG